MSGPARINHLPVNDLDNLLSSLETEIQQIKASEQPIADSVVFVLNQTSNQYDASGAISSSGWQWWRVTVTPSTMQGFWGVPIVYMYADTPTNFYPAYQYELDFLAGKTGIGWTVEQDPSQEPNPGHKSWLIGVSSAGSTARNYYFKVYIEGLDNASITVTSV